MDLTKAALIVVITLVAVVIINAAIYYSLADRNRGPIGQIKLLQRAAGRARSPWQDEDDDLQELSRLVEGLRPQESPEGSAAGEENPGPAGGRP